LVRILPHKVSLKWPTIFSDDCVCQRTLNLHNRSYKTYKRFYMNVYQSVQ